MMETDVNVPDVVMFIVIISYCPLCWS